MDIGKAKILTPRTVVAGEYTTVEYQYTTGHPIDDTGFLKISFRYAGDFGTPQWQAPEAPNYCMIETTGNCRLEARWDPKGHTRPWGGSLVLKVMGGYLDRGDVVRVVFGAKEGGSPGWQMQTFCEKTFELKTLVDPIASYQFKELSASPTLKIVPGEPVRTVCLAPSQVQKGKRFRYWVKHEDRWGNPVKKAQSQSHEGFAEEGVEVLTIKGLKGEGTVRSNPIRVGEHVDGLNHYWADFHGQSEETIGTNSAKDYFLFARDCARLDIASHQGNDFQITDAFWEELNALTAALNKPGVFVTFPGYEWSGNTPLGGDRNVWYSTEGGPIYRSSLELVPGASSQHPVAGTAAELYEMLRKVKAPRPFCAAHVGGRYADIDTHDPVLEHAVEVHSAWGTFEWMIEDAFARGYRVGICANSDGHKGRPGASYPGAGKFGSLGGLTCVLAERLDRESVQAAYEARHFYGTTGNRPLIRVGLQASGRTVGMMGDILKRDARETYRLRVEVQGTHALERVEVWNGNERVTARFPKSRNPETGKRFKILWSGAEVRGRARLVNWDGHLKLSGNRVDSVVPLQFLNPHKPMQRESPTRIRWLSNTTGSHAGMILNLERPRRGKLELETTQKSLSYAFKRNRLQIWKCGGLKKQIEIRPLPTEPGEESLSFEAPIRKFRDGDNPLFIKVYQEDGHMAWSSPIYLI